jgi:hypothetical protein
MQPGLPRKRPASVMQSDHSMPALVRDLIFSPLLITSLVDVRGPAWSNFILSTPSLHQNSLDQVAFILMIARLVNCAKCNMNSFRSSLGCSLCVSQSLKRFHGPDEELLNIFFSSQQEVNELHMKEIRTS